MQEKNPQVHRKTGYRPEKPLTFTLYEEIIANCQNVLHAGLL